ncbi:MAG: Uma2 family endonuclease [Cyanobacteria bacterium P01_D01_bin.156]
MVVSRSQQILTDTWVKATWDEFLSVINSSDYQDGRAYFDAGYMRIEMAAFGAGHGRQNAVALKVADIFAALNNIRLIEFLNCSFRQVGERECQPDVAFYIGEGLQLPPQNNTPINIELFGPPTLVIEVGASSLSDDLGNKRLLYERLGVQEYWVVDVNTQQVIAFSIADGRSGQIEVSEVLPGLKMSLVEEALVRSQTDDDGAITRWLMQTLG